MRLVDADQFEVISWRAQGGREYANGFDDGVDYVVREIDKAETVEAIPIEWLREKIKGHTDGEGWQDYLANSFGLCIEEWQKE